MTLAIGLLADVFTAALVSPEPPDPAEHIRSRRLAQMRNVGSTATTSWIRTG
jgi:hypothetical protein